MAALAGESGGLANVSQAYHYGIRVSQRYSCVRSYHSVCHRAGCHSACSAGRSPPDERQGICHLSRPVGFGSTALATATEKDGREILESRSSGETGTGEKPQPMFAIAR